MKSIALREGQYDGMLHDVGSKPDAKLKLSFGQRSWKIMKRLMLIELLILLINALMRWSGMEGIPLSRAFKNIVLRSLGLLNFEISCCMLLWNVLMSTSLISLIITFKDDVECDDEYDIDGNEMNLLFLVDFVVEVDDEDESTLSY
jgi:hypothetical protein